MAEALTDDHSPLGEYLRQQEGSATPSPPSPTSSTPPSPSSASHPHPAPSPPPPHAPHASSHPPHKRTAAQDAALERLKYALATSALLSAKLGDAVQLYPPLEALSAPSSSSDVKGKGKGRAEEAGGVDELWPEDWQTAGQSWADRGAVENAERALKGLVGALRRLSLSPVSSPQPQRARRQVREPTGPEEETFAKVEEFVRAAQELDLRVVAALNSMKELECVAHGLGLSDPLPPISRIEASSYLSPSANVTLASSSPSLGAQRSPRIPSPLSASAPARLSAPAPLRALPLRQALASALSDALAALHETSAELNALLPADSALLSLDLPPPRRPSTAQHAPQASLSELLRHASTAAAERAEVESFTLGSEAGSLPSSSRPSSVLIPSSETFDPFHPTSSTFGGIDRRAALHTTSASISSATSSLDALSVPLRRQSSLTLRSPAHRVRPSLGAVGAFGLGTAATAASPARGAGAGATGRKRRPVSMGGWSGQSSAFRLKGEPGSPALSATEIEEEEEPAAEAEEGEPELPPVLLLSLQERLEDIHDARRSMLWRVLEALGVGERGAWQKVGEVVARLAQQLQNAARRTGSAHEAEFADDGKARTLKPSREERREKEKRRRSGYYSISELDSPVLPSSPLLSTPLSATAPNARQAALARLTASHPPSSPSPARRPPSQPAGYANFAPTSTSSSALPPSTSSSTAATAAQQLTSLSLPLRALQAKLRLLSADLPAALSAPSDPEHVRVEAQRVLATYDSLGAEIDRLAAAFQQGRRGLRVALGVERPVRPMEEDDEEEETVEPSAEEDNPVPPSPKQDEGDEGAEYTSLDLSSPAASPSIPLEERQALLDAALSLSLSPPAHSLSPSGAEAVFEAVAGPPPRSSGSEKLSREERIRRMREAREALAIGRSVVGVAGEEGSGKDAQRGMVGELREVLKELNRERGREGS
ncbi:hypothetical protein JCM10213_007972 [Rhodosporidiobolus nylandii]